MDSGRGQNDTGANYDSSPQIFCAIFKTYMRQRVYWSNVFISSFQVFLGILAATIFIGQLDFEKIFVITSNLVLIGICLFSGWRLSK